MISILICPQIASYDATIRIWNARTAEPIRTLTGHMDGILDCDISLKDKYLISASMDCSVRLWSIQTGKCLRIYRGHRHWVKSCRFTSDNQYMVSAALDKQILVWSLRSVDTKPKHIISSHADYVLDLTLLKVSSLRLPPSTTVTTSKPAVPATTSTTVKDGPRVRILVDGAPVAQGSMGGETKNTSPSPSGTSTPLPTNHPAKKPGSSGGGDGLDLDDPSSSVHSTREGAAAGERFVSSSKDRTVRIWNARTGRAEHTLTNTSVPPSSSGGGSSSSHGSGSGVIAISLACSPDGTLLAIGMLDNTILLHSSNAADGYPLLRHFRIHNNGILCIRFITNRTIAVGTATGAMQLLHF
jgi:WD40 repeat protein